jgi:hypothetical protein
MKGRDDMEIVCEDGMGIIQFKLQSDPDEMRYDE